MKRLLLILILTSACARESVRNKSLGDPEHGKQLVAKYGCTSCHAIPNVEGPKGMVGPPLDHIASHPMIGARMQNTPQNMMVWLQNPQTVDPNNSMPNLGITPADARDLTAFLQTLK